MGEWSLNHSIQVLQVIYTQIYISGGWGKKLHSQGRHLLVQDFETSEGILLVYALEMWWFCARQWHGCLKHCFNSIFRSSKNHNRSGGRWQCKYHLSPSLWRNASCYLVEGRHSRTNSTWRGPCHWKCEQISVRQLRMLFSQPWWEQDVCDHCCQCVVWVLLQVNLKNRSKDRKCHEKNPCIPRTYPAYFMGSV